MPEVYGIYVQALQRLWGPEYWVAWPPGTKLALGDVGVVRRGRLTVVDRLSALAMRIEREPGGARHTLTYDSDGAVTLTFKASGQASDGFQALTTSDVGAQVHFTRQHTVLAAYSALTETRVARLSSLAQQLVERFWAGRWPRDHAVVTHVVSAASATILIGAESGSKAELRLSASARAGALTLGDLGANVSVAHRDRIGLEFLGHDLTPFFRLLRLRGTWTGRVEEQFGRAAERVPGRMPVEVMEEALESPGSVVEEVEQTAAAQPEEQG